MNDLVRTALVLASRGKKVFPCVAGSKEPMTAHGFKDATTDESSIRTWWTQYPEANLALATGAPSGLVVLDVDVDAEKGKDGMTALAALTEKHGFLPETLKVRTPRGGQHVYFKHPGPSFRVPCSTEKLGNGLDVRGDGGYVLVPPSRTDRGEYRWESKSSPADLPPWLIELLTEATATGSSQNHSKTLMRALNSDEDRVREALRHIPASLHHDEWIRILMALHSWNSSQGKLMARDWSASCPEKFRDRDFEAAWRSFKPNGGVGLGTLFEVARNYGWRGTRATKKECATPPGPEPAELAMQKWPDPPRPEAFYGVIGEFVLRLEPHTESDPMALLVQALVGFGNLVGRHAHFSVEADKHYCNLNAVAVGNSSKARKGTSWGHVIRLLREVDSSWPRYIAGLSTGEGLIACVRDPVTKVDKEGQQQLVDEGINDKRLLAVESEFGRTLQCSNREGNTLSAVVRQAFDTGDLRVAVKGSPQISTGAHISIIGHITVVELNLLLTKSDTANGFANRFLWVAARRSKLLPEGGKADSLDLSDIVARLRRALDFAKTAERICRDERATELWREIYLRLSQERPGLLGAVVSRAEALVMRISMLLAITDCSQTIRDVHLRAAIAIWDYCEDSAAFIFGDSLGNPTAERVLRLLQDAGEPGLSLARIYEALSGHIEKEELHAGLKQLHGQGLAECRKVPTSGRPSQVWFATKAACERSEQSARKATESLVASPVPSQNHTSLNSLTSPPREWEEAI